MIFVKMAADGQLISPGSPPSANSRWLALLDKIGVPTSLAYSRRLAGHQGLSGLKQHLLMERGNAGPADDDKDQGKYTLITDEEDPQLGMFDKRLPCFGCGIGWFSFLLGFAFPLMWFYATILYFSNYYRKDPRERTGLAASAITALIFSMTLLITLAVIFL